MKSDISNATSPNYQKVTIRSHVFDFSPKLINDYLTCKSFKSQRKGELDVMFDMNKVIMELTAQIVSV